jgi:hypothetical protein
MVARVQVRPEFGTAHEPCFVYGSNLSGRHDDASASLAVRFHGATDGKWNAYNGNAYAIPYRDSHLQALPLQVIRNYVATFLQQAEQHPDRRYRVARFACESTAYTDGEIAPLFKRAPKNVDLPGVWRRTLDPQAPVRLLIHDPALKLSRPEIQANLDRFLALNAPLWNAAQVEIVAVGISRAAPLLRAEAARLELGFHSVTPNPGYYGDDADIACEIDAIWYASHFLCIAELDQTVEPHQIRMLSYAMRGGLPVDELECGTRASRS